MVKEQSLSVLIAEADKVFSEYVRLKDAEPFTGIVKCFVTGQKIHWKEADAGHYVARQQMGTRWDEMNVHACTVGSNRFDPDHHDDYDRAMSKEYSTEELAGLYQRGRSLLKPTRFDISILIAKYKEKVKELRKQKHL